MELCQRTSHQRSRQPVGTGRRRRPRPSGSCASSGLNSAPSTERSSGWPASSATAPSHGRTHPRVFPAGRVARPRWTGLGRPAHSAYHRTGHSPDWRSAPYERTRTDRGAGGRRFAHRSLPKGGPNPNQTGILVSSCRLRSTARLAPYLTPRYHHAKAPRSTSWCPTATAR
jgi:hypothetical protein